MPWSQMKLGICKCITTNLDNDIANYKMGDINAQVELVMKESRHTICQATIRNAC